MDLPESVNQGKSGMKQAKPSIQFERELDERRQAREQRELEPGLRKVKGVNKLIRVAIIKKL